MTLHLFHRWGKWEQYTQTYSWLLEMQAYLPPPKDAPAFNETRQRRNCLVCGKQQDRLVAG